MISIQGLKVEFGSQVLFDNVSYVINKRDKIALVGKNGAGKTTMLKIIAGEQMPTSGTVARQADLTIGYLPQQMVLSDTLTVKEEAQRAFEHIQQMDAAIDHMNRELAERTDYESEEYQELIERVAQKTEMRALLQSENIEAEVEKTLIGLGFERSDFGRPTSEFSGGWRMRIELAKLLLRRPDVLLLDEPTNHLDMRSKDVLKEAIREFDGTVIVVSHDREFLDGLVSKVYEFADGHVREHIGGIYDYLRSRGIDNLNQLSSTGSPSQKTAAVPSNNPATRSEQAPAAATSYEERKEQQKQRRRLEKRAEEAEKKVTAIEAEMKELEGWMSTPSGASNPALFESYAKLKADLAAAEEKWEEAMMELES